MVAAISVCMYHFASSNPAFMPASNPVARICKYGYLGVDIFFIISGFIICYSLPANYSLKDLPVFVKKRLIRVEPPYLASIIFTLLVAYVASLYTHNPVSVSWINLLYHIGYINNFTTNSYINVVYWTLGIEFQFYLLIGLLFGIMNRSICWLAFIVLAFLGLSFISIKGTALIFEELPLFCAGILMFYLNFSKRYSKSVIILLLIATFGIIIAHHNLQVFFTGLLTIAVIVIPMHRNKVVNFLAMISYSLYLVHVPVGGRIINLSERFVKTDIQRYGIIVLDLAVCIITSYIFYLLIERWTTTISKKIKYLKAG